jgi:hypothetical protein
MEIERKFRDQQDSFELAHRQNDGIQVFLFWHKQANILTIALIDAKQNPPFATEFEVPNEKGMEAFNHPYAHMPESQTVAV